jgi:hypothetical protein
LHPVGVVGRVAFEAIGSTRYTGVFKGSENGIIRLSSAFKQPLTAGMALKFMRDGVASANLLAMHSMDGTTDWNFFSNDLSTHVERPRGMTAKILAAKFISATTYV